MSKTDYQPCAIQPLEIIRVGNSNYVEDANARTAIRRAKVGQVVILPSGSVWIRSDARQCGSALVRAGFRILAALGAIDENGKIVPVK